MKTILYLIYCLFPVHLMLAQNVGIGTTTPAASAALDVHSTTQGLLPPRLTYAQRNTIMSPAAGLMIWCSDCAETGEMQVYSGTTWMKMQLEPASVPMIEGAPFGGGIIAYIFQPGDPGYDSEEVHGLITTASDVATGSEWGCLGNVIGAFGTTLGTGLFNTQEIVVSCLDAGIAARICYDLSSGGYTDWFLPSKDELNKLYINRVAIGGFDGNIYWSSSEINDFNAWLQDFTNGATYEFPKNFDANVRPIRYF